MKKNDWALLLSVILYSYLFYQQSAGINFLIFNCCISGFLIYRNKELIKNKQWLLVVSGAILSSFFIFLYSSPIAIWANIISLMILSALSFDPEVSFITALFQSFCNQFASFVFMIMDWIERRSKQVTTDEKRPFYAKLFIFLIPLLIAIIFFLFYQSANPLFYDLTKDINLDFISIGWIFFTLGGLILLYGFYNNRRLSYFGNLDKNTPLVLSLENTQRNTFWNTLMKMDTENISGVILFSMLNLLLITVNSLDLHYLWFDGTLPKGVSHKAFVHDGIGTLITSLVVAILIILFYFRGGINFYEKNKWIRRMAYVWIIQNIFMILSTAYRNNMYIQESGLSYKKIGVYVYLLLTIIGLITAFIKVYKIRTNWYLFKTNALVYYFFLIIGCIPNWDMIITNYNIKKHYLEKKELEKYLLLDLSFKNLPELMSLPEYEKKKDDLKARDYYYYLRGTYFESFQTGLDRKLILFLREYKSMDWRSYCYEKQRTYNDLLPILENIKTFSIYNDYELSTLSVLSDMKHLKKLQVSGGIFTALDELKDFKEIEHLELSSNGIDSLKKIPALPNLRTLNLSNNNLKDLKGIEKLRNLEVLNLGGYNTQIQNFQPLWYLKDLKKLTLSNISDQQYRALKKALPNTDITITNSNTR